jgi:hypothetical protein
LSAHRSPGGRRVSRWKDIAILRHRVLPRNCELYWMPGASRLC